MIETIKLGIGIYIGQFVAALGLIAGLAGIGLIVALGFILYKNFIKK